MSQVAIATIQDAKGKKKEERSRAVGMQVTGRQGGGGSDAQRTTRRATAFKARTKTRLECGLFIKYVCVCCLQCRGFVREQFSDLQEPIK